MRSRHPDDLQALLFTWRKRFWLVTAIVVFLVGDVALWKFGPPPVATAILQRLIAGETSTIATAASFSVSAGSFTTQLRAAAFAAALNSSGLPTLVRSRPEDRRFQVLVGPYVSTDEAEQAQRALAAWGLGEVRLVVDDTMRGRPQRAAMFVGGETASDGVVIVAAPGMSSVVFEMPTAPRQVEAHRTSATTIDISIGQVTDAGETNVLHMPEGMLLASELSVDAAGGKDTRHARLVVPEGVQSRLRLEDRRVYVDLAWPKAPWEVGGRAARATQSAQVPAKPSDARSEDAKQQSEQAKHGEYREQRNSAVERFKQVQPFLISAIESPDTEVLAVLARTLDGVSESLTVATPPSDLAENHQLLLSSLAEASRAMAPFFVGDRRAAVHKAIAAFEEARK
jgi:hypothetical protein